MRIAEYTEYNEEEIAGLYKAVGWVAYTNDLESLRKGFENSLAVLAAYDGDKLVGIIRAVGDGATILFLQDILIYPEYQRQGIGSASIRDLLDRYRNVRQIELVTDNTPRTIAFYKSLGFREFSEIGCCGFMKC